MKKSFKVIALILALAMVVVFAACGGNTNNATDTDASNDAATDEVASNGTASDAAPVDTDVDFSSVKVGFICLHDENSTYDLNFINAAKEACAQLGIPEENYFIKTNIDEKAICYETAADLVDMGCSIIFADSFGHETYMIQAAQEFPEVQFCHSTGVMAGSQGLANYHNAFASIYEGRYLAGVAAGMKLNEMIEAGEFTAEEAKIGYVGAFTYAEVISGYTSFFLGARSVCPTATMDVTFTGSWYDEAAEKEAANKLIAGGCKLISQHADSMGAPTACEEAGVPDVSYNGSTVDACPNTFIISSKIDWTPYYIYAITAAVKGDAIDTDWTGTLATGSVKLTDVNTQAAAAGTQEKIDEVQAQLEAGTIHVFDTSAFTVNGETLTTYEVEGNEVIGDGYFHESEFRSAPCFDLAIDGITRLDENFG